LNFENMEDTGGNIKPNFGIVIIIMNVYYCNMV
jgi:hypothetical protein